MRVLAIETATAVCGAAIIEDGHVKAERSIEARQIHSQKIMGLIDEVLQATHSTIREIDGIAVSIGPGSFTGLRIGLSTAKGLAHAAEKPIVAVPTLQALAMHVVRQAKVSDGALILPMIDARRNEVYAAGHRIENGKLHEVVSTRSIVLSDLYEMLDGEEQILLAGDGTEKFQQVIMTIHADQRHRFLIPPREHRLCNAAAIGLLGELQLLQGERADVASLEPFYVKEFYTTTKPQPLVHR